MKLSKMAIKTSKNRGHQEYLSQEILFQSSLLTRHSTGIYSMGNLLVKGRENLISILRGTLEKYDCTEISLPTIQPVNLWQSSGRLSEYKSSKQMFTFIDRNENEFCLGPTHEEIVVDYMRNIILSYRDLPLNVFQIGSKYRDEIRSHGGLTRSREFMMEDGYSFHATATDMELEYERMKIAYSEFFYKVGLDVIPVKAVNAEMGGKASEEFMLVSDIGEDKVLISKDKTEALNIEMAELVPPKDYDVVTAIELGHIFKLGDRYSSKMKAFFIDKDGKRKFYYMGCYGIGINRTLAAILEANADDEGLVWPEVITPYSAYIVYTAKNKEIAFKYYETLKQRNIGVIIDDRESSFGEKVKDAKLLGIPYVIILGNSFDGERIEVEERKSGNKEFMSLEAFVTMLQNRLLLL